jgi:hypothetical protein
VILTVTVDGSIAVTSFQSTPVRRYRASAPTGGHSCRSRVSPARDALWDQVARGL